MARWADLAAAEPELAARIAELLCADATRPPILATVRDGSAPRLHPVNVGIRARSLWTFVGPSAKLADLRDDGRYALHAWLDPERPTEGLVRGRARLVEAAEVRAAVARNWAFEPDDTYALFELGLEAASLGVRASADEWPPRYRRWSEP